MATECTPIQMEFQGVGRRRVAAAFDGGHLSSEGGSLLLREADTRVGMVERLAACFTDHRRPDSVEHRVDELLRQRIFGLALGYEDLNDHDALRLDPLMALASGKEDIEGRARRREEDKGKPLASKCSLNRLELTPEDANRDSRYKKIVYHGHRIEELLVTLFLERQPRHGHVESRYALPGRWAARLDRHPGGPD